MVALVLLLAAMTAFGQDEFAGEWHAGNDEQTSMEVVGIVRSGNQVAGRLTAAERGYYSGRVSVKQVVEFKGAVANRKLSLTMWSAENSSEAVSASGELRGEYLVLRIGNVESVYARPGRPLVRSGEGSPEAAALAKALAGNVYSRSAQASGRTNALVGGRVRLAVCASGRLEYDASDVAATGTMPGGTVDFGRTVTRRGAWSIVLRGGKPVLRADWEGTGGTYNLVAYFDITPGSGGRSATVDGLHLPVTGGCP